MTDVFDIIKVDADGNVTERKKCTAPSVRVLSTEIMPKNYCLGAEAFIVDKMDVAFSDGKGNWYRKADTPVVAGNPWSALF